MNAVNQQTLDAAYSFLDEQIELLEKGIRTEDEISGIRSLIDFLENYEG